MLAIKANKKNMNKNTIKIEKKHVQTFLRMFNKNKYFRYSIYFFKHMAENVTFCTDFSEVLTFRGEETE